MPKSKIRNTRKRKAPPPAERKRQLVEECRASFQWAHISTESNGPRDRSGWVRRERASTKKLHLNGRERTHLKWDCLSTFLESDLGEDQELKEILHDCGCGHLFDVLPEFLCNEHKSGFAAAARQYLGMGKPASYRERLAALPGARLD